MASELEPTSDLKRSAHLATLGDVVRRTTVGSWLLRAWSALLVSALLAVAAAPEHRGWVWMALLVAIGFWMADAHFGRQQRLYRKLRERVGRQRESEVDFSMNPRPVDGEAEAWVSVMFSRALLPYHLGVIAWIGLVRALL